MSLPLQYLCELKRRYPRDKSLTACYVYFMKAVFHFSFIRALYARGTGHLLQAISAKQ